MKKKTISPVVSIALLLVVAVSAVVGFQNFLGEFNSGVFSDTEQQSKAVSNIGVEGIFGDTLYIKSSSYDSLVSLKITDSTGEVMCEVKDDIESILKNESQIIMSFDNNTFDGNNIEDLSGYNNNGIVYGANYSNNDCISGECFEFDGTDDYINIGYASSGFLDNVQDRNEITISAWVKL